MKIYLAGNPQDHVQINGYAKQLEADGFEVVSTWHMNDAAADLAASFRKAKEHAQDTVNSLINLMNTGPEARLPTMDHSAAAGPSVMESEAATARFVSELQSADWVIADLDVASIEAGFALSMGKQVTGIGRSTSLLTVLFVDQFKVVATWSEARGQAKRLKTTSILAREFPMQDTM